MNMESTLRTLRAGLVGLTIAQILGTVQVYQSNQVVYRTVKAGSEAGYLAIPNDFVLPSLLQIKSAVIGGFFFTLSVGSGLTLLSLVFAWFWSRILKGMKKSPVLMAA